MLIQKGCTEYLTQAQTHTHTHARARGHSDRIATVPTQDVYTCKRVTQNHSKVVQINKNK